MDKAPNILLMGGSGVGKTYSLRTLITAGITPFCVFTEPGFEVIEDIPDPALHWKYLPPGTVDWQTLIDSARSINTLSNDSLQKLPGMEKTKFSQFIDLITTMNNFKCDRCGQAFGDVSTWGPERAIVIDGLSGIGQMSMDLTVGAKPIKTQPDWGVAMDNLERFVAKMCNDTNALFVLIAHVERELDEAAGSTKLMTATLGRKLAPKLPRNFSDVVYAYREVTQFYWSTASASTDTKARNLPLADKLPPDFGQILKTWAARRK